MLQSMEREKRGVSFDSVVNYDLEYQESVFDNIAKYLENKLHVKPNLSLYEKFKFVKQDRDKYFLTHLGVLFCQKRDEFFPLVKIECARFKGDNTKVFLDQATYDGDIIDSIEQSINFIKRNIKLGATIGEIYRENRWEYPLLALREIVINAVVHRDYSILGSDIKVAIFDDMIEVTSPGFLIIDKDKLGFGYSELRNQNLGSLFKKLEIIEQWGTGYEKVKNQLQEYPEINLEIDDNSTFTQVRFVKKKTIHVNNEGINEGINELLEYIQKNPSKRVSHFEKEMNVPAKTLERWIKKLKEDEKIAFEGSKKSGGYVAK